MSSTASREHQEPGGNTSLPLRGDGPAINQRQPASSSLGIEDDGFREYMRQNEIGRDPWRKNLHKMDRENEARIRKKKATNQGGSSTIHNDRNRDGRQIVLSKSKYLIFIQSNLLMRT
jgi:hypothetical protein